MRVIANYIRLMRPKHYLKNFLVLVPIFFDLRLFDLSMLVRGISGFAIFSLLSSVIYIFNDIQDAAYDRRNEKKRNRPIASGAVSVKEAILLAGILCLGIIGIHLIQFWGIGGCNWLEWRWCLLYFGLNIGYSLKLKRIPIIDVLVLAFGFVIRIMYGGALIGVTVSYWLYMTVLVGALYMALGKRRNEFIQGKGIEDKCRSVLSFYNHNFLDKNMYMFMGLAIMFYALWCRDGETVQRLGSTKMIWTVPLVIALAMKYSLDIESGGWADPIEVILNDKVIIVLGIVYAICMFTILYLL